MNTILVIICERCGEDLNFTATTHENGRTDLSIRPCTNCLSFSDNMSGDEGRLREQKRLGKLNANCFGKYEDAEESCEYMSCDFIEACHEYTDGNLPDTIQELRS